MRSDRGLLAGVAFAAFAACADVMAAPASPLQIDKGRIDAALDSLVSSAAVAGDSALIYQDGKEVYFHASGFADREAKKPMARDAVVQIFSMTKPVTGVALMQLYEQGKFQLDDPLSKYLPEYANMKVFAGLDPKGEPIYQALDRPITVRDILRHTAGFTGDGGSDPVGRAYDAADPTNKHNTLKELTHKLATVPLLYQPGTRWHYSEAVDVQAYLVEKFSGERFDRYLQAHVFGPLKMTHTGYLVSTNDRPHLVALYKVNDKKALERVPDADAYDYNTHDWPLKRGNAGLTSTIDDYSRFARMLLNGGELDGARILKPETVALMHTDMLPPNLTDKHFLPSKGQVGFGVDFAVRIAPPVGPEESAGAVGEYFWDGAASTLFWVDPLNHLIAVYFTQHQPCCTGHREFRDAVYGIPQAPTEP